MSDDIDGPEWDPPELLNSDAPEIYIAGPGRFQQVVRTLSAVAAAAAIVWGVLWLGDESTKQTDLMNDQNELIRVQWEYATCAEQVMAEIFRIQNRAIGVGADGTNREWRNNQDEYIRGWIEYCFPAERFGDE